MGNIDQELEKEHDYKQEQDQPVLQQESAVHPKSSLARVTTTLELVQVCQEPSKHPRSNVTGRPASLGDTRAPAGVRGPR